MDSSKQRKRMMGNEAEFRGVQREAINAITAGESPVVAVMPTSGGKSLLFMLPAFAEHGGTTVVVVPLIALRGDIFLAVHEARDIVCGVGQPLPARRSSCSVSDARVSRRRDVYHVFEPASSNAAAGSDRDRRVPYRVEPACQPGTSVHTVHCELHLT
jgi:hypothetical protein